MKSVTRKRRNQTTLSIINRFIGNEIKIFINFAKKEKETKTKKRKKKTKSEVN